MADSVSFSIALQHLPSNNTLVPPVNLANNAITLAGPLKYRLAQYVVTAGAPLTVSCAEFTTVTGLLVFNGDSANVVSVTWKALGAGSATAQPVGVGGFVAGTLNIDPTSSLVLTTAAASGTSTVTIYLAGT